jgi:hypothetical protein
LTQFENNTPASIYQQVADKFGVTSAIAQATKIFMESDSFPVVIPLGDIDFAGFRDYFCELLQPIALVQGMPVSGNAAEAEKIFFGDAGFDTCSITFNSGAIGGLSDSLLTNADGKQIKLSSKGKSGAMASAVNLLNAIEELRLTPTGQRLMSKYQEEISIVQIVKDQGHFMAPLQLAVLYGIIDASDVSLVTKLKNYSADDKIVGAGILSPKLESFYKERYGNLMSVVLNINNPVKNEKYEKALEYLSKRDKAVFKSEGYDSGIKYFEDPDGEFEYVVFEPEQIHILGSKQDIEGFKTFVQTRPATAPKQIS